MIQRIMTMMNEKKSGLSALFTFVGGLSGLIALGTLLVGGGKFIEKVNSLDARVSSIEKNGTTAFKAHESLDTEREISKDLRLKVLEENIAVVHRLETKFEAATGKLEVKLDNLKEQLEKHEKAASLRQ